ncbi:MAG: ketopantoate reductase family protein [Deltaproteobacteria bacterium]|nr:ketopantoate reductase family protein [Deltaproteobacteria bacterium]
MKILVVGLGGIGGIIAASLFEQGLDVHAVTTNETIREAIDRHGFLLTADGDTRVIQGEAIAVAPPGPFEVIILATQPPSVEAAAREVVDRLAPGGSFVVVQNGLCEPRIEAIAGPERVVGAIIAWGASMTGPGQYERTSSGGFTIGRMNGRLDEWVRRLEPVFEPIGPVELTSNLAGARWSKLAINCAISSLGTLAGERLGTIMTHRFVRRLALEIMTEAVEVARRENVQLAKVSGTLDLDWLALTPDERRSAGSPSLVGKHAMLLAVGARYRRLRSSMLSAIERGREPAVDFLNGEVTTRGARHGVATPVNREVTRRVWALHRGETRPSVEHVRELFESTRSFA